MPKLMPNKLRAILLWGGLAACPAVALAQATPPVQPKVQPVEIPPVVELPPPATAEETAALQPLTADEAALIALRRQPNIALAGADIAAAAGRTRQAESGLKPQVGVGAGYSHTQTIRGNSSSGGNTFSGFQATAAVSQLLFDFNRTRDQVRLSAALERSAALNLTRVQADTVQAVKQAFYIYRQNQQLVTVTEADLRNRQDQLALAQARLNTGLGLPGDVVRAQTQVAAAVTDLEAVRNDAALARVNLALAMGIDPRTPLQVAESTEPAPASLDVPALVDQAIRQRPEMRLAQTNITAAGYGVSAARSFNKPSIAASLGVGTRGNSFPTDNDTLTVGVALQWNPFDGGLTRGLIQEAQAGVARAQADLAVARQAVVTDVSSAYLNLRTAEQQITTASAHVANAEESVRIAEGRYRGGLGTFLEITDAQSSLLSARRNLVNARAAQDQARVALARATGIPLPAPPTAAAPVVAPVTPAAAP